MPFDMSAGNEDSRAKEGRSPAAQGPAPVGALVSLPNLPDKGTCRFLGLDGTAYAKLWSFRERVQFTVSTRTQPLVRLQLTSGARVRAPDPGAPQQILAGTIVDLQKADDTVLYCYIVRLSDGREMPVHEDILVPLGGSGNPVNELRALNWYKYKDYFARWALQDLQGRWCEATGGLPGILGARVRPLGHQLYTARRVLWDRLPRFVLADEVGLGKTIETGLILQALLTQDPEMRVLVIAPGSMSRQWLAEIYLRFGARAFTHVDARRLRNAKTPERLLLAVERRLIVSSAALTADPQFAQGLADQEWDMVVIDEAHQFPPGSPLYELFQRLALTTVGLLLLSATPSKRDVASLAGLLALVAPDVYKPEDSVLLEQRQAQQQDIWDRLNLTNNMLTAAREAGQVLEQDILEYMADDWAELLPEDPVATEMIARLRAGEAEAATELVAYVQEFYRLDHRIVRNRRKTLRQIGLGWAMRAHIPLSYQPSADEAIFLNHMEELPSGEGTPAAALRLLYWRFAASTPANALAFLQARLQALSALEQGEAPAAVNAGSLDWLLADPGPGDEQLVISDIVATTAALPNEREWLKLALALAEAWVDAGEAQRVACAFEWIRAHLIEAPEHQVLVFVQDSRAVIEVACALRGGLDAASVSEFHADLPEEQLAEVAFAFQHDPRCRVLVSDELGGEGRNFQNASAVVHLDMPLSATRLEQRIGRLDRIGREAERPVRSVTVTGPLAAEQALLAVHRDAFGVFDRSVGGLEFILPRLQRELALAYSAGAQVLTEQMSALTAQVEDALAATDEAFDLSLDATKPQLDLATRHARHLDEAVESAQAGQVIMRWARRLGMRTRPAGENASELMWARDGVRVPLTGLGRASGGELQGTFDRAHALTHENLQYLGPGHQLVDSILATLTQDTFGRVTAMAVPFPRLAGTWLLHVLVRSRINEALWPEEGMTAGLALRARSVFWPEIIPELVVLTPGQEPAAAVVTDAEVRKLFSTPTQLPKGGIEIQREKLLQVPNVGALLASVPAGAELARSLIGERQSDVAAARAKHLAGEMRAELGWLKWRAETGADAEARAGAFKDLKAREALLESVRQSVAEIDGVALICLG